ncbi:MAG: hypothetical protein RBR97_07235 [Bacteroidales bacterium]|nr:hypothetical protein [Bacteroidales bacterium]
MTREEFDKLYLNKAVHCDTEEKANEFLALADSLGYKWRSGKSLIEKNEWKTHEGETCYHITEEGVLFGQKIYDALCGYQIIKYHLQPKFKVGDKVRVIVNSTIYSIYGKIGVIEDVNSSSPMPYYVKIDGDNKWLWTLSEKELEKVEEQTYEEETIDDIIEEIKDYQKSINVLLNRLERKAKVGNK